MNTLIAQGCRLQTAERRAPIQPNRPMRSACSSPFPSRQHGKSSPPSLRASPCCYELQHKRAAFEASWIEITVCAGSSSARSAGLNRALGFVNDFEMDLLDNSHCRALEKATRSCQVIIVN